MTTDWPSCTAPRTRLGETDDINGYISDPFIFIKKCMQKTLNIRPCSSFSVKWSKAQARPDLQNNVSSVVKEIMIFQIKKGTSQQQQIQVRICSKCCCTHLVCLHYLDLTWTSLINSIPVTEKWRVLTTPRHRHGNWRATPWRRHIGQYLGATVPVLYRDDCVT